MPSKRRRSLARKSPQGVPALYRRVSGILEAARTQAARSVNTAQVMANWLIGQAIVEQEQKGANKAGYGDALLDGLAQRLTRDAGVGYSATNLRWFRQFYLVYPALLPIHHALRDGSVPNTLLPIHHAVSDGSREPRKAAPLLPRAKNWKPGTLSTDLSWTHYRMLLKVEAAGARSFYEIEALKNNWSARELERQIGSLLFERLARSKDRKGVMKLATRGQVIRKPTDIFKDPLVAEFLNMPISDKLQESELEQALIDNLRSFMLEMGKGFAFVARQERITLDGDHFYADLVFYHIVLKCYVIIDLKVGKLAQQDLAQIQLYVNYFDRERRVKGDNPTLGLVLCTDKNEAMVKYTLSEKNKSVFTSRYKLHLPSEAQLRAELRREMRELNR